jgi:WD40 repeat protein
VSRGLGGQGNDVSLRRPCQICKTPDARNSRQHPFIAAIGVRKQYLGLARFGAIVACVGNLLTIRRKRSSNSHILRDRLRYAAQHRCSQEISNVNIVIFSCEKVEVISVRGEGRVGVIARPRCHDLRVAVRWEVPQKETSLPVFLNHTEDVLAIGRNGRRNVFASVRHPRDREVLEWFCRRPNVTYPDETLWRSKVDGSDRMHLTYPPLRVATPHWAPDGKRIIFSTTVPGQAWNLFVISFDGGESEQLTSSSFDDLDPTFSPDGNTVAFGRTLPGQQTSVQLLDINTRQVRMLAGSEAICCSRWSPDGHHIVALSGDGLKLMLFDVASQKWREWATNLGTLGYMTWSPDSRYVGFDNFLTDDAGYMRISVADGKLERITSFKKIRRFWTTWGPWTGLAPDGSPLVVRDISTQEIYALDVDFP